MSLFSPLYNACLRGNYALPVSVTMGTSLLHPWPCQLHYLRLPKDISEDHVILMDSTVSTGAAAMMAVRVLLVGGGSPPHSAVKPLKTQLFAPLSGCARARMST